MRNFTTVAQGVDAGPIVLALARNPDLWDANTIRTTHPGSAHAQASDILVFYGRTTGAPEDIVNDIDVRPFPAWKDLPQLRPVVFGVMAQVNGVRLGRVVVTRLPPGAMITPHTDWGDPAIYFDRYQLMLQCLPGANFYCGGEVFSARTGDLFLFDNQLEHSVQNQSADDRLALIMDVRSA